MPKLVEDFTNNTMGAVNTVDQLVGVEIEVEGVHRNFHAGLVDLGERWVTHPDGSLRNNGLEFVTPPLPVTKAYGAVRKFYEWDEVWRFKHTMRTSTHVHIDMRPRSMEELRSILTAYVLVEPLLMAACGPAREENIYCVPFYRANNDLDIIRAVLDGANPRRLNETCKYSALYLEPLLRFGTMEFRMAPVWDDVEDSVRWLRLLVELVTSALERPAEEWLKTYHEYGPVTVVSRLVRSVREWFLNKTGVPNIEVLLEEHEVVRQATLLLGAPCGAKRQLKPWVPAKAAGKLRPLYDMPLRGTTVGELRHNPFLIPTAPADFLTFGNATITTTNRRNPR
jgi:hypothetical protein